MMKSVRKHLDIFVASIPFDRRRVAALKLTIGRQVPPRQSREEGSAMMPRLFVLAAMGLIIAFAACANPRSAGIFSQSAAASPPERSIILELGKGKRATIYSYRFTPKPGLTKWFMAQWCGVEIMSDQPGSGEPMPVMTIGVGQTETVTCLGLKDAGLVPPLGARLRIGLLYRTASPNFPGVTPVALDYNASTGQWTVDDNDSEALADLTVPITILSMRAALGKK